ncbi:hypothetical protein LMG23992_00359 [Cupriavidus laharis]|uniref:Uncharacterized protein n=1 Tax=Cupriavidus laharis TaxID=151654 RepID=A0ABM8WD31_9BURK|nr:hypothetical protein LMG23992_00359 [Cupriavidus laharis]
MATNSVACGRRAQCFDGGRRAGWRCLLEARAEPLRRTCSLPASGSSSLAAGAADATPKGWGMDSVARAGAAGGAPRAVAGQHFASGHVQAMPVRQHAHRRGAKEGGSRVGWRESEMSSRKSPGETPVWKLSRRAHRRLQAGAELQPTQEHRVATPWQPGAALSSGIWRWSRFAFVGRLGWRSGSSTRRATAALT